MATLEFEGQFGVIDSKQVQQRGVQIVHVYRVLHDVVTEIIGAAVGHARLDAAAGQPDRETSRMMVAAVIVRR